MAVGHSGVAAMQYASTNDEQRGCNGLLVTSRSPTGPGRVWGWGELSTPTLEGNIPTLDFCSSISPLIATGGVAVTPVPYVRNYHARTDVTFCQFDLGLSADTDDMYFIF